MSENGYTLSDIAAVSGNKDGIFGGNSGGMWIFALLILMLIGGGNAGCANNGRSFNEELLMNTEFNNLSRNVADIGNRQFSQATELTKGICNLGYTQAQLSNGLQTVLGGAIDNVRYDMANFASAIQATSTANTQKVLDVIAQNKIDSLQSQINQLSLQNAMCGIPRINSNAYGVYPYTVNAGCGCCGNTGNI